MISPVRSPIKRNVCFYPTNKNCWDEYLFIAKEIMSQGLAQISILADCELEERNVDLGQGQGLPLHVLPPMPIENAPGAVERILFKACGPAASLPFAGRRFGQIFDDRKRAVDLALNQLKPDTVVVSNGRTTMRDLPLIKACKERDIRTLTFPLALPAYGSSLTSRRKGRLFEGKHFPKLVQRFPNHYLFDQVKKEQVSYYPAHVLPELQKRTILPPNPWVVGAGLTDHVLLAGENERSLLLDDGAHSDSLLVTGLRAHDQLYDFLGQKRELRERLFKKYGLPVQGKLVIAALPQSFEEGMLTSERQLQEIRFVCGVLRDAATPTLISLHPRMHRKRYEFVEKEYGLTIAEERLADFLPAGDIFSSSFSSTVQWTVLCGIPSIIWPWFGVDYDIFDHFSGIKVIKDKNQLLASYRELITDEAIFAEMAEEQNRHAEWFSPFDGKCLERIIRAICLDY